MGIFSRKKKQSQEAEVARQVAEALAAQKAQNEVAAAQQKLSDAAEASRRAAETAERRKKADASNAKQQTITNEAEIKRKQITSLERAITRFENECKTEVQLGRTAKTNKNTREALRHAKRVKTLKGRISQYENQLRYQENQLDALINTGTNINMMEKMGDTNKVLESVKLDTDEVNDTLQDTHELVSENNDVTLLINADAASRLEEDDDELLAELEDDEQMGIITSTDIPEVPSMKPAVTAMSSSKMPTQMARSSAQPVNDDEAELKALEAELELN